MTKSGNKRGSPGKTRTESKVRARAWRPEQQDGSEGESGDDVGAVASTSRDSEATRRLTPLKNSDVGALIPVENNKAASSAASTATDDNSITRLSEEDEDDDVADYASSLGGRRTAASVTAERVRWLHKKTATSEVVSSAVSREELKHTLLSVMERKEELHEQCQALRKRFREEVEAAAKRKQDAADSQRQSDEAKMKLESRIRVVSRENELLKHQLKKYVGAVQKLREGPQAYETLAQLDKAEAGSGRYVDYHFEASEYEKKLIQVAEMHGELLEFNEHLQRVAAGKEAVIARMRRELETLRGPLPEELGEPSPEDDLEGASVLLHIWIPSVFLSGGPGRTHHVYQVYIRIKDEEWNIYRRYSDFFALHKDLKKREALVAAFDFPPKKTVGYKADKVVEERRKRLQNYLRGIVNLLVQTNPALAAKPNKENVLMLMPFFGEHAKAAAAEGATSPSSSTSSSRQNRVRSQSQPRSFFSRNVSHSGIAASQLAL